MKTHSFLLALGLLLLGCEKHSANHEASSASEESVKHDREINKNISPNKEGIQPTKSESALLSAKDKVSDDKYVDRAIEAIREVNVPVPQDVEPVVSETAEGIRVTWPVVREPGVRYEPGPDIQAAVIIERDTGAIIAVLGG